MSASNASSSSQKVVPVVPLLNGKVEGGDFGDVDWLLRKKERMGEVDGLKGAMRGKVPEAGVGYGDGGESDAESEEPESDSEPERRRPSEMGMGSEWVKFFSSEDIVRKRGKCG